MDIQDEQDFCICGEKGLPAITFPLILNLLKDEMLLPGKTLSPQTTKIL